MSFKTLCPSCKQDGNFHNLVLKPMENCCPEVSWQGAAFTGNFPSSPYPKRVQGICVLASSFAFVANSGFISQSCLQLTKTPLRVPALLQFIKEETGSSDALLEPRYVASLAFPGSTKSNKTGNSFLSTCKLTAWSLFLAVLQVS